MALKDSEIRHAKLTDKNYKLFDGGGLYILINSNGRKYWRLKYKYLGKEKTLSIGVYPQITLAQARKAREEAKELLRQNIDPSQHKQEAKRAEHHKPSKHNLKTVATEWLAVKKNNWSAGHYQRMTGMLKNHIYPTLGNKEIDEISGKEALDLARAKENEGYKELPMNILQTLKQVATFANATGQASNNPFFGLSSYLKTQPQEHHRHVSIDQLESLLRAIDDYQGV